jgi:hypothetical protein
MSDSNNLADVLKAAVGREPIGDPPPDDGPDDDDDEDDGDDC